ncbi:hypothetical protein GQX73_g2009 [Xylaria multiplex]|uniref:Uncharacterized protein n=1 Tax=Xylaria multiplex TaxID=323545 RepID=A0A7C8NBR8_9PEZI|nr:hypothetical protein GQX73_g2009 [Xylaria multiplex]
MALYPVAQIFNNYPRSPGFFVSANLSGTTTSFGALPSITYVPPFFAGNNRTYVPNTGRRCQDYPNGAGTRWACLAHSMRAAASGTQVSGDTTLPNCTGILAKNNITLANFCAGHADHDGFFVFDPPDASGPDTEWPTATGSLLRQVAPRADAEAAGGTYA